MAISSKVTPVARAQAAGLRQMLALIGDSENIGSIGMHASLGFTRAGVLRAVGVKFGRWLDVVIMQRSLGEGDADVPLRSTRLRDDVGAALEFHRLENSGRIAIVLYVAGNLTLPPAK